MVKVKTVKAIGIGRISSEDQKKGYGFAVQKDEITHKASELGCDLVDVWEYQESATKRGKRPEFDVLLHRLIALGKSGEVQQVIFSRPDRLGREGEDAFLHYFYILEVTGGLQVRFARQDSDPNDPYRNFHLFMEAFKANNDAKTIRTNTLGSIHKRGNNGRLPFGHVPWPFDYKAKAHYGDMSTGLPTLVHERAEWVRKWRDWILTEKVSLATLCRRMSEAGVPSPRGALKWSPSTVTRILSSKTILGEFWQEWTKCPVCPDSLERRDDERAECPNCGRVVQTPEMIHFDQKLAILSRAEYEIIQKILTNNRRLSVRNTKKDYTPLHLFVWCGSCGRKAEFKTVKQGYPYVWCHSCRDNHHNVWKLWDMVKAELTALAECLNSPESKLDLEQQRQGVISEIADLEKASQRVIRAFAILPDYSEAKLKAEVERIEGRKQQLERDLQRINTELATDYEAELTAERLQTICKRLAVELEKATPHDWKGLLRDFNVRVIIENGRAPILRVSVDVDDTPSALLQNRTNLPS